MIISGKPYEFRWVKIALPIINCVATNFEEDCLRFVDKFKKYTIMISQRKSP